MFDLKKSVLITVLLLSGCINPVGQQDPQIALPAAWHADGVGLDPTIDQHWWTRFADPTLDALVAEALAGNKNLQIAKARVEQARADRTAAQASLLPQINAGANASRGNQGYATNNQAVNLAGVDLEASWELDLFGRNQARTAQAAALLQASDASRQAVTVGLLAELARNYFDLRNDQRQIALTRQNLATQQKTLDLIEAQRQGALASRFDVERASAQLNNTRALIPAFEAAASAARNRIAVLLGVPPGAKDQLLVADAPLAPLDPQILIAAPAVVIAARPDVRVAERQFAASIAAKQVATAELFPDISLTALFGRQVSTPFSATPWGVGANLVQPVLNFGRIESSIDAADAQQRQASLAYQQTVLEALENMEDALSSYLHETERGVSLDASAEQTRKAAELARQQYVAGFSGLLDVLVAERDRLAAEAAQTDSAIALRKDLVTIYAAAGGGWAE